MSRKDMEQLLKRAAQQGFTVQISKAGHYRITKAGRFVCMAAQTPSDGRSINNTLADLRRAGYQPDDARKGKR